MTDLEQTNFENISDDEVAIDPQQVKPTFSKPIQKSNSDVNKVYDEEGNVILDYNELSDDENDDDDEDDDDADDADANDDDDDDDDASIISGEEGEIKEDDGFSIDDNTGMVKVSEKHSKKTASKKIELPTTHINLPTHIEKNDSDYESDEEEEEDDEYLQKFDKEIRHNYLLEQHPESQVHNYNEVYNLAKVQRNKENIIIDDLHKTIPILTKYEKTRILGQRAKQINNGATPLTKIPTNIMDGYLIALKELEEKVIPVIIRRPLPNGVSEYWHLKDLEIL